MMMTNIMTMIVTIIMIQMKDDIIHFKLIKLGLRRLFRCRAKCHFARDEAIASFYNFEIPIHQVRQGV